MTESSVHDFQPRNAQTLQRLTRAAADALLAMSASSLRAGQLPPKDIMEWAGEYLTERLLAVEQAAQATLTGKDVDNLGPDEMYVAQSLQNAVIELSEFLAHCQCYKQLTLEDRIKARLRARLLHLPAEFDHSYEGMLPRF